MNPLYLEHGKWLNGNVFKINEFIAWLLLAIVAAFDLTILIVFGYAKEEQKMWKTAISAF